VLPGHALHLSPFAPENPALHSQEVRTILFGKEFAFDGHDTQGDDPLTDLYVLATHMEHVPPSCPDHPALQIQAGMDILSGGECEMAVHTLYAAEPLVVL